MTPMTQLGANIQRRAHVRIDSHRPVRIRTVQSGATVNTILHDISLGGLQYLGRGDLRRHETVRVEIDLRDCGAPIQLEAQMAWMQHKPHSDQYLMGLTFTHVPPHALTELAAYINDATAGRA